MLDITISWIGIFIIAIPIHLSGASSLFRILFRFCLLFELRLICGFEWLCRFKTITGNQTKTKITTEKKYTTQTNRQTEDKIASNVHIGRKENLCHRVTIMMRNDTFEKIAQLKIDHMQLGRRFVS